MTDYPKADVEEAKERLRGWVQPGDTLYTVLGHVSRSGMVRDIGVREIVPTPGEREPVTMLDLDWNVARVTGRRLTDHGVRCNGAGMDMGFDLIYSLSRSLFPGGFDCIGEHCPANDHSNGSDVKHHTDGGYALRQRWI